MNPWIIESTLYFEKYLSYTTQVNIFQISAKECCLGILKLLVFRHLGLRLTKKKKNQAYKF